MFTVERLAFNIFNIYKNVEITTYVSGIYNYFDIIAIYHFLDRVEGSFSKTRSNIMIMQ